MQYIYDVLANFGDICYDFYEWNKNDKITHLRKIPVFRIDTNTIQHIIRNGSKIDMSFYHKIKNKTEIYNSKTLITACVLTDGTNATIIQLGKSGVVIKKSSLLLDEELDILKLARKLSQTDLVINEFYSTARTFLTRFETERKRFILSKLKAVDDSKLFYLYFECFNEEETNRSGIEKKLRQEIMNNNDYVCSTTFSLLKLICTST